MFFRRKSEGKSPAAADPSDALDAIGEAAAAEGVESEASQFLTGESQVDSRTVQVLLAAIAGVSESKDLEGLLTDILDRSIEITGAERGLLLLRKPDESLELHTGRTAGGGPLEGDGKYSTTITKRVSSTLAPLRATVQSDAEALELGQSVLDLKLRAVMCVPLTESADDGGAPTATGVLYVDSRAANREFSVRDLSLFAALAQHISIALENARLHLDSIEKLRMEQSLELASAIQRDLMPAVPEDLPGYEVHGWYGPAEQTAGDFYDFVRLKDGGLAVVVGDATGHGIGPALITASVQAGLRSTMRFTSDPAQVVTLLNEDLSERVEDGRFLTLFLGVLKEDGSLVGVNAGAATPYVWRKSTGAIDSIPLDGPALGMIGDFEYSAATSTALESGDVLVVYTDGLTEARSLDRPDALFGEDGLQAQLSVAAGAGKSAKDIALHLVERAMSISNGVREDDVTVVVVRRL